MKKYLIERQIPGAGKLSPAELKAISQHSCDVIGGIGTDVNDGVNRGLYGSLSIARVYNRVLSVTEVLQNYNATKGRFS